MNSAKKESISITAIINEVNQFDNLEDHLQKRDREPVWDGELRLYKSESNKSNEIVGRIPVQVKSVEEEKDTKNNNIYYRVKVSDIENYKKDKKGAIFFVVQIFPNRQTSIFYKVFDLKEIDNILSSMRKGQKTLKIEFKKLEKNHLDTICIQFIENLNIYKEFIPVEKVEVYEKKTICYDYNTKYEFEEMKKSNEVFYETKAYKQAVQKLKERNVIILHGEPWVGKTSTARKLVMDYINQVYMFVYGNVDDLVKIKNQVAIDGKIICLIDDFLGSNVEYLEKNVAESTLDKIIGIFKNSKDKKLIMTTRTYIYNNCKQLFYKFYNSTAVSDEYLIDVADYNYLEKGSILYNHLKKNKLIGTKEYKKILNNRFYETIIRHENFNPGVIALICERMKNKNISDINEYIEKTLEDPNKLWEEEYQKLSEYEKILLIIIVLFGVNVPEQYVKEQFYEILKNENKQIESEELLKSIDRLTVSFIKVTFDESSQRKLEVCKHSISDYIINKIRKNQIDIKRYIKSAKYVEVLHYIDLVIKDEQEWVKEELAKKVENDIKSIKSFFYDRYQILYGILARKINTDREKLLKQVILELFENYNIDLILDILEYEENSNKPLYKFCLNLFKKYIIESNDEEYLYNLRTYYDCEIYFNICLRILNYEKNSNYMMSNLEDVKSILISVISEDVTSTIEEIMLDNIANEIIEGKTIEEIKIEHIDAEIHDEIPSLKNYIVKLFMKKYYRIYMSIVIFILMKNC